VFLADVVSERRSPMLADTRLVPPNAALDY
jgi:hypothetical protein